MIKFLTGIVYILLGAWLYSAMVYLESFGVHQVRIDCTINNVQSYSTGWTRDAKIISGTVDSTIATSRLRAVYKMHDGEICNELYKQKDE